MEDKTSTWIIVAIIGVMLLGSCFCCLVAGGAITVLGTVKTTTSFMLTPIATLAPAATPVPPTVAPLPDEAAETLESLRTTDIPAADLHELGIRFMNVPPDTPRVASTTNPDYPVGTKRTFHVSNVDSDEQFDITAVLKYKTPHVYMWVEEGARVNEERLRKAADLFEQHTYPTDREFFGSEWTPGVDGDPHLSILHARNLGSTVAGYFSSPDSYVSTVRPDSNEMEMFYINLDNVNVGDDFYNGVLAHEFQHMIHWNNDRNETTWLNEGCSELAMALNDRAYPGKHYDVGGSDRSYTSHPDTQLDSWPEGSAGDASNNYGASYLFMEYFLDRFGEAATKELVSSPLNGMEGFDAVLQDLGTGLTHKDIFADWAIANLLDNPDLADGRYGYHAIDPRTPKRSASYELDDLPVTKRADVRQYGVDYIEIKGDAPVHFTFTGSTQNRLLSTDAHSGQYLWWSNRADESDTSLTRLVDLRGAQSASLDFWEWYHIEEDWDYAYVVVGTTADGTIPTDLGSDAIHWTIVDQPQGEHCTTENPNGNSYGCGITGSSNGWEQAHVDLSAYTGQQIALRFEYITDAAVNQAGFAVDDLTLTVDGNPVFSDDVESNDSADWIAQGFVRHANVLPQEWIVQLVMYGHTPQEQRLLMLDDTSGEWDIPLSAEHSRAVIVISAIAPVTTEPASYEYTLTR